MLTLLSAALALVILLLALRATNRLTLRLRVHAGMRLSTQPQTACPHLGLAVDPFIHAEGPSEEHRCYLWMQRDRIDLAHQKGFCLTAAHRQCPWLTVRRPGSQPSLRECVPGLAGRLGGRAGGLAGVGWRSLPAFGGSLASIFGLVVRMLVEAWRRAAPVLAVAAPQAWRAARLITVQIWRAVSWLAVRGGRLAGRLGRGLGVGLQTMAVEGRERRRARLEARQAMQAAAAAVAARESSPQASSQAPMIEAPVTVAAIEEPVAEIAAAPRAAGPSTLEELLAEGVKALDQDQEQLAYHLFRKASEMQGADQRAWFWRAKTAETVEEVVFALEHGVQLDPANPQLQAQLAWAKQRLDRQQRLASASQSPTVAPVLPEFRAIGVARDGQKMWSSAFGEFARLAGGLMALVMAALWMTAGLLPLLGRALAGLTAQDQHWVRAILPTLNVATLPGNGHLLVPLLDVDPIKSLPFVLGFLFLFTGRGVVDGDAWARSGSLLVAAIGAVLCASHLVTPQASHLGLALCIGLVVASIAGGSHQQQSTTPLLVGAGYS